MFVGGRFDADLAGCDTEGLREVGFHRLDVRENLRLLSDEGRIDVDDRTLASGDLSRGFLEKNMARRAAPLRICIRKKMANIRFAHRSQNCIADGVHEKIGIGMAIQTFVMGYVPSPKNQLSPFHEGVNVVTNANANHGRKYREVKQFVTKPFPSVNVLVTRRLQSRGQGGGHTPESIGAALAGSPLFVESQPSMLSGRVKKKVVPWPSSLRAQTLPP